MKPDHESLHLLHRLHRLHQRVFADPEVRAVLDAGFVQLALELRSRPEPPHATCTVPIELFTGVEQDRITAASEDRVTADRHDDVRLCRLFLLRRGARMAVPERHRNSVQRLVSYRGSGSIHQGVPGGGPESLGPRAIYSPGADDSDLARHWDIVPVGVWHYPQAHGREDWATVTFHSAAEGEIVDEFWNQRRHSWSVRNPKEER